MGTYQEVNIGAQGLSNSLWAAAKLQDAAPEVVKIVPALAAQIPLKAVSMNRQDLSNSLWALKDLPTASPAVPRAVLALVEEIPSKIGGMDGQALSVFLGESFPIDKRQDMFAASAARLNPVLPTLKGKDLMFTVPMVLWACGRANAYDAKLFAAVPQRFSSAGAVTSMPD